MNIGWINQNFNIFTFASNVHDDATALNFANALGMIPQFFSALCPTCGRTMHRQNMPAYKFGFRWRCQHCRYYPSSTSGTIFERSRLTVLQVLQLIVVWFFAMPVSQAAFHVSVSRAAAIVVYETCREVCEVAHGHDEDQIGGFGDIVECDESHLFTRKYNRGRRLRMGQAVWVFGGISRLTKRRFIVRIPNKARATLWPIMLEHIAQDSWVFTDEHRSYRGCGHRRTGLGFRGHAAVNHSRAFVRPLPLFLRRINPTFGRPVPALGFVRVQVHTNNIERMWRGLKTNLRTRRDIGTIDSQIGEYLYRNNTLNNIRGKGPQFLAFVRDLVRVHPGFMDERIRLDNCNCPDCP